jgi:hypothetical protein
MFDKLRRLQLATRILMASADHKPPNAEDVIALRALAESEIERTLPVDELAREVMIREVRRDPRQPKEPRNAGSTTLKYYPRMRISWNKHGTELRIRLRISPDCRAIGSRNVGVSFSDFAHPK